MPRETAMILSTRRVYFHRAKGFRERGKETRRLATAGFRPPRTDAKVPSVMA